MPDGYLERPELCNVPIRHQMSVAESWARRQKPLDILIEQHRCLIFAVRLLRLRTFKVEDLPRLAGTTDEGVYRGHYPEPIAMYREALYHEVIEPYGDFYEEWYGDIRMEMPDMRRTH